MANFGRWLRQQPSGSVTQTLVGINIGMFLLQLLSPQLHLTARFALQPLAIAEQHEWWRLITAAFLHAGIAHIAFNMFALWQMGSALEQMVGPSRFLTLYFVSAIGGSVFSYLGLDPTGASVGASGAIFGLLAAFIVVGLALRLNVTSALMWLGINILISFTGNIDWRAHFGGLAIGALFAWLFVQRRRRGAKFDPVYYGVVAMVAALLLVAYLLRTQMIMSGTPSFGWM